MTFYTFAMHTAVSFGAGSLQRLPQTVQDLGGRRALIVTDPGLSKAGIPLRAGPAAGQRALRRRAA